MALNSSLTDFVTALDLEADAGAHVVGAAFLDGAPTLALGNGRVRIWHEGGSRAVDAHPEGSVLCHALMPGKLVTGGDDGRIVTIAADGTIQGLADENGTWIDAVAARADGAIAWSCGRNLRARDRDGVVKSTALASVARGVAFMPKGYRIAAAQYNGAALWFPNTAAAPDILTWKGAHIDVTLSPDGRFVVTSMQENALHGWRIDDRKDMRMSGYPAKTRSLSWSGDGQWLATSGAEACIVWPFQGRDGPMGKAPRECGVRPAKVTCVAFHPKALVVAIGYEDGWILMCRLTDAAELLVRARHSGAAEGAITALAWESTGSRLVYGTALGEAGVLVLPKA
ncbi:MAG: WD40 repeat domain-containing protein [Hyphomicrobiales bacterium]|nr:WD40 repeat domain-containing protein [Hyphomicrobiales bacterium]